MLKTLYAIETDSTNPYHNLALEEVLLSHLPPQSCILYLWQNAHTVVIGKNQNAWKECRTEQLREDGGNLVRRPSGGGAVYHDLGNLNFTFLLNQEDYDVRRQLSVIMEACRAFGIPTEISGRNDVLACGRKFSGNAFLQTGGKCSHHGTILVNVDTADMMKYLRPSKEKLQAKGVNSVESRVVNLLELAPQMTIPKLREELFRAFTKVYGMAAEPLSETQLPQGEIAASQARFESYEWTFGKTLAFTLSFGKRFSWGEIELQLQVDRGYVADVKVYSDALDPALPAKLELALQGAQVTQKSLCDAVSKCELDESVQKDLEALIMEQNL